MSGLEVVGVVAALLEVAGAGVKLAQLLHTIKEAKGRLAAVRSEVQSLSATFRQLSGVFEREREDRICSDDALADADLMCAECGRIFAALRKALGRFVKGAGDGKGGAGGEVEVGFVAKVSWTFGRGRVDELVAALRSHQNCAHTMVSVLTHARVVRGQTHPTVDVGFSVQTGGAPSNAPTRLGNDLTKTQLPQLEEYKSAVRRVLQDLELAEKVIKESGTASNDKVLASTIMLHAVSSSLFPGLLFLGETTTAHTATLAAGTSGPKTVRYEIGKEGVTRRSEERPQREGLSPGPKGSDSSGPKGINSLERKEIAERERAARLMAEQLQRTKIVEDEDEDALDKALRDSLRSNLKATSMSEAALVQRWTARVERKHPDYHN